MLEARLYPKDAFPADNYVAVELPQARSLHVVVYSDTPEVIMPALQSDPRLRAEARFIGKYQLRMTAWSFCTVFALKSPWAASSGSIRRRTTRRSPSANA